MLLQNEFSRTHHERSASIGVLEEQGLLSSYSLLEVIEALHSLKEDAPGKDLTALLTRLSITFDEIEGFVRFHGTHYTRNLVAAGKHFELFVMCWMPGQRTPIHDHAQAACAMRIVQGSALETVFEPIPGGYARATDAHPLTAGTISDNPIHEIHQIEAFGNAGLVTLQAYSPPLNLEATAIYQPFCADPIR